MWSGGGGGMASLISRRFADKTLALLKHCQNNVGQLDNIRQNLDGFYFLKSLKIKRWADRREKETTKERDVREQVHWRAECLHPFRSLIQANSLRTLPPLPAEAPGVCEGTEERVCACCWPLHCGSSALTGSPTGRERTAVDRSH